MLAWTFLCVVDAIVVVVGVDDALCVYVVVHVDVRVAAVGVVDVVGDVEIVACC